MQENIVKNFTSVKLLVRIGLVPIRTRIATRMALRFTEDAICPASALRTCCQHSRNLAQTAFHRANPDLRACRKQLKPRTQIRYSFCSEPVFLGPDSLPFSVESHFVGPECTPVRCH